MAGGLWGAGGLRGTGGLWGARQGWSGSFGELERGSPAPGCEALASCFSDSPNALEHLCLPLWYHAGTWKGGNRSVPFRRSGAGDLPVPSGGSFSSSAARAAAPGSPCQIPGKGGTCCIPLPPSPGLLSRCVSGACPQPGKAGAGPRRYGGLWLVWCCAQRRFPFAGDPR